MSNVAYILNAILIAIFFFNIAYICLINILSIYFDLQHSKTKFKPLIRNYHSNPLVTVIVPAWNEEVGLNKTLESIVSSTYKKIQIIVVDDGSKDNTLSKALEFQKKYKSNDDSHIIVITQQNKGKAEAINTALEKVEGKYVFTVDADSYLSKEAIGECVYSMQKNNADAVSGRIIVGNTDNFYGLMQYYEFLFTFLLKKSQHITNSIYVITGALAGFKTSTLKSIGKFNGETKGEDLDITLRFQIAQKRLIYSNDAILVTEGPSSFGLLVKQRTRWKFCTYKTLGLVLSKISTDFKNRNLSFFSLFEVPNIIMYLINQVLFPLLIIVLIVRIVQSQVDFVSLFFWIYIIPVFLCLVVIQQVPSKYRNYKGILIIPVLFSILNIVEFIATIKALSKVFTGKSQAWDKITRVGLK